MEKLMLVFSQKGNEEFPYELCGHTVGGEQLEKMECRILWFCSWDQRSYFSFDLFPK